MNTSICAPVAAAFIAGGLLSVAAQSPRINTIRTTSEQRKAYLAHASMWHEPPALTPSDILNGPPGAFPYTFAQATGGDGISCTFSEPGRTLAGKSPKFLCLTDDKQSLRLKYWNREEGSGNREVFAAVAATRLLWALGFNAIPAMPINVQCRACPADPMSGEGSKADRRYVALMALPLDKPIIVSSSDRDQGWSWQELYEAVKALPPGDEKLRQSTHLAALTLLGVLVQHGDRKPEQQALFCNGEPDQASGSISDDGLKERKDASSCASPAVALTDIGATFGGAGKTTNESTAKMNLEKWAEKRVFKHSNGTECRGELTVSMAAGSAGEADPPIAEEGRRFLVEQLHRLTPDHIRALFKVARVDQLPADADDKRSRPAADPIQAWVDAFQDKVRQIESRRCAPLPKGL